MKKRYLAIGISLGAVASYLLVDEDNRNMLVKNVQSIFNKWKNNDEGTLLENAGIPDQIENTELSQLENAKMVSEGSQYGVQYYNEVMENESE